ncbi:hypothetical protein LMT8_01475 [Leuconostoc mesenteroides subsp. cremoris TIFN8]|nr:hypothetical protein LMT8_01475 [Leuconostoc mesenteroides subsp. cremoris TIFN8]
MNALQWTGEVLTLIILICGSFLMGLSVGNEKGGKR